MKAVVLTFIACAGLIILVRMLIWDKPLIKAMQRLGLHAYLNRESKDYQSDTPAPGTLIDEVRSARQVVCDLYRLTAKAVTAKRMAKEFERNLLSISHRRPTSGVTAQALDQGVHPAGLADARASINRVVDEMATTMREVADLLRTADEDTKELATFAEETAYSISRLDRFLQDMADRGRELEASTDAANRIAFEGTKVVEEMAKENQAIVTAVKEAATAVEGLGRWSREVGKILEVIRDIADETNLLSLNAAIIAAQSGEHGKAFGVVAEEIRGLAERTSSSTQEISDLVKTLQRNVADVVESMKKSLQRVERGGILTSNAGSVLEKVFESFESSRNLARDIAASTLEHKMESSHVVRSIRKVADIARQLESEKFSKWTAASESVAVARAVAAVASAVGESRPRASGLSEGGSQEMTATRADSLEATCLPVATENSGVAGLIDDLMQKASSLLEHIDSLAEEARSACRRIPFPHKKLRQRCWEITNCPQERRSRCAAYGASDPRCFLIDMASATSLEPAKQSWGRCYSCPAFKAIIETVEHTTPEMKP